MDSNLAEVFLAVVTEGGISKAAERLHVSQPTISRKLRSLEMELGVKLIERGKGVDTCYLTPEGDRIYPFVKEYYDSYARLVQFNDWTDKARLGVASVDSLNARILLSLYPKVMEANPGLKLTVMTNKTESCYSLVSTNLYDIGFVLGRHQWPNVVVRPFISEKFRLLVRADGRWNAADRIPLEDLDPAKEIFQPWGPEYRSWHEQWLPRHEYSLQIDAMTLNSRELFKLDSWCIVPDSVAMLYQDSRDFLLLDFVDHGLERQTYYIVNKNANPACIPALRSFIDILEQYRAAYHKGGN